MTETPGDLDGLAAAIDVPVDDLRDAMLRAVEKARQVLAAGGLDPWMRVLFLTSIARAAATADQVRLLETVLLPAMRERGTDPNRAESIVRGIMGDPWRPDTGTDMWKAYVAVGGCTWWA